MKRTVFIAGSRIALPESEEGKDHRSEPYVMRYDEFREVGVAAGWVLPVAPRQIAGGDPTFGHG